MAKINRHGRVSNAKDTPAVVLVGESGPELVNLPDGDEVRPRRKGRHEATETPE
jgi:hypothetical protein